MGAHTVGVNSQASRPIIHDRVAEMVTNLSRGDVDDPTCDRVEECVHLGCDGGFGVLEDPMDSVGPAVDWAQDGVG